MPLDSTYPGKFLFFFYFFFHFFPLFLLFFSTFPSIFFHFSFYFFFHFFLFFSSCIPGSQLFLKIFVLPIIHYPEFHPLLSYFF
ncbi:hypothetical protein DKM28_15260 [Methanosarcina mazei]|uniref:Uncharacterized protein n=1 Tax=Methanosarcina mazei TaxID=2209 RepID=A0A4P8R3Z8_METMZ|nr:hypothetical protein DKM28_15260 [Methanosarcina mazei]